MNLSADLTQSFNTDQTLITNESSVPYLSRYYIPNSRRLLLGMEGLRKCL